MTSHQIFGLQVLMSLALYALAAAWYLAPALRVTHVMIFARLLRREP